LFNFSGRGPWKDGELTPDRQINPFANQMPTNAGQKMNASAIDLDCAAASGRYRAVVIRSGREDYSILPLFYMANPSKAPGNNPANPLPFEDALKKLEGIVEAMESDDLPLETLLAKYEEGSKLVKQCRGKLSEAELKIQQLEKNADKEMKLKPFEAEETI
jgi:exodeoxyribonuclease VII small subunit